MADRYCLSEALGRVGQAQNDLMCAATEGVVRLSTGLLGGVTSAMLRGYTGMVEGVSQVWCDGPYRDSCSCGPRRRETSLRTSWGICDSKGSYTSSWPSVDVKETADTYVITADMPGMEKKDIHVDFSQEDDESVITIWGERKEDEEAWYREHGRRYGRFRRRLYFPKNVKKGEGPTTYNQGVLSITLKRHGGEDLSPK